MPENYFSLPATLLTFEAIQRQEQGDPLPETPVKSWADFERLSQGVSADEPDDLPSIRAQCALDTLERIPRPVLPVLEERIHGAWLGRAAGCMLGKPLEGMTAVAIRTYLQAAQAYPLVDYVPWLETPPVPRVAHAPEASRGRFTEAVRDDDLDYTLLGLHILEQHGAGFSTIDVADAWLHLLPYGRVYTAERVVYAHLVQQIPPEQTARYRNPYREWIGALIRADAWAYANPGDPARAASWAYRDATLSHVRNGMYGAMWAAGLISAALCMPANARVPRDLLHIAGQCIPRRSRLALALDDVLNWFSNTSGNWHMVLEQIDAVYGHYHWVHTIPNALRIALALLASEGDYTSGITVAVMCGADTDSNAATVGSVLGGLQGANALPSLWTAPLNDRLRSALFGMDPCAITELAQRSVNVASLQS